MESREILIRRETEAAKALLAGMRATLGDEDTALLADILAGETNLFEAIDAALGEIDETEVMISGLKEKESQFSARRRAMEERLKRFRALDLLPELSSFIERACSGYAPPWGVLRTRSV